VDGQEQDGPGVKILIVFYSSSLTNALDQQLGVHLPDNAISAFLCLYPSKISYRDLCCQCANSITTHLSASEVHAVIVVNNWMIPSSCPCAYDEIAEATSRVP